MTLSYWIILIVSLLVGAIILEAYLKRGRRSKPLHEKFNATERSKPPLGMKATDIEGFNQASRLNNNLARHNSVPMIRGSKSGAPPTVKKRSPEDHAKIFTPKDKK